MTPHITFVSRLPDAVLAAKEMLPSGFELTIAEPRSADYWAAMAEAEYLTGFVDFLVDEELFACAPNLKLIQTLSAGYDQADLAAARNAQVPIANNGGANSVAVAEHAILLMLAVSRQLVAQHANVSGGRWRGNSIPRLYEMAGKTLGIIGFGSIGKKTAKIAAGFAMNVIYHDIQRLPEHEEDRFNARFRLLNELLQEADIVSLHVPLNESTHHMIGASELAMMKPTAILINTCRGPVIDETALHACLADRKITGAGLDVFDQEPPPPDNPLFTLDNVTLTGHLAGPTWEANTTRLRNAYDNIQRVARGDAPLWVIPELL